MQRWLVLGCGYTGTRLAARMLAERERIELVCTRRTREGAAETEQLLDALAGAGAAGLHVIACDLLEAGGPARLPLRGARVVVCAPPGDRSPAAERQLAERAAQEGALRLVYLSSTGVYPRGDGSWVDEESAVGPTSEHGRRRLEAEQALLGAARAAGLSAVALRAAGIYGPGRGVHERMRSGTYRVLGAGDTYVSRIHVDDLVTAILAAARATSLARDVYNVADDQPTTAREHADGIAALLGLPPPPSLPPEEASEMARALLEGNRRVSNRRLREELGVVLAHPGWRSGVLQALAE